MGKVELDMVVSSCGTEAPDVATGVAGGIGMAHEVAPGVMADPSGESRARSVAPLEGCQARRKRIEERIEEWYFTGMGGHGRSVRRTEPVR